MQFIAPAYSRHSELYKANRRSEVRTSEPVCRADSESHSWTNCEGHFVLSPDGERVRVRGRSIRHPKLVLGSHSWTNCEGVNNF